MRSTSLALAVSVFDFAVEFLRQKIEPAADRPAVGEQPLGLRDMRGQTVELLADIGLAGEHDRFLVQAVAVEALGGRQQRRHLLGEPRLDRFRLAAGGGFRTRGERGDFG